MHLVFFHFISTSLETPQFHHHATESRVIPYRQKLFNFHNTQYYGDIVVGEQNLTAIYDTGSFELIVLSELCSKCEAERDAIPNNPYPDLKLYDHEASDSFVENGTIARHVFGSGPVQSVQGYDTVFIPREGTVDRLAPVSTFYVAKNQAIWEIVEHNIGVLNSGGFNAIAGIGPQDAPAGADRTLLQNLGIRRFSVCLTNEPNGPGFIVWNDNQEGLRKADLALKVMGKIHWAVHFRSLSVNGGRMPRRRRNGGQVVLQMDGPKICSDESCVAILDSGTSLIAGPTHMLEELSEFVGPITEDCSNVHSLPTISLQLGDRGDTFELPPSAYVLRMEAPQYAQSSSSLLESLNSRIRTKNPNGVACIPAFMPMDKKSTDGAHIWILGMPFFRQYYTLFDREKKVIVPVKSVDGRCFGKDENVFLQMSEEREFFDRTGVLSARVNDLMLNRLFFANDEVVV